MVKIATLCFCVCLFSLGLYAQTNELDAMLKEIENNNIELQSYSTLMASKQLELKTTNNLPDPQASVYYLPFGNNNTGAYTEFQLSQSLDFPTVYKARKELVASQQEQLELDYTIKKQEVLLEAKKHYNDLVYLNKSKELAQFRIEQAALVQLQIQNLFDKGQIGILESNKSKIVLLKEQFKLSNIENDISEVLLLLKSLNGGKEISLIPMSYKVDLELMDLESIVAEKSLVSPNSLLLKKLESVAQQEVKLSRNMGLPNLTFGVNYQGISGERYAGLYGGLSLPLWNNKNKVKAAKINYTYQQELSNSDINKDYSFIEEQFNDYQNNLTKYNEYRQAFDGLNSTSLLLKSYELGQISFMEYYMEIKFYEEAEDEMLQIEHQLNQLKAEIFKFKL